MARAVSIVSPVIIFTSMPASRHFWTASFTSSRSGSRMPTKPSKTSPCLDLAAAVVDRVLVLREVGRQFGVREGERAHRVAGGGGDLRLDLGADLGREVADACRRPRGTSRTARGCAPARPSRASPRGHRPSRPSSFACGRTRSESGREPGSACAARRNRSQSVWNQRADPEPVQERALGACCRPSSSCRSSPPGSPSS